MLRFKKGKPVHADSSISPGAQITINDGYYSAGFRCMYQGSPAIISADHGVVNGESCQIGNQNGSSLGTVTRQQCSGSVDACIITLASGVSATSITNHGVSIAGNSCITSIATNSLVYKDGYAGGVTYGNVISSSSSCYYNGVWISGLIKSDYYSTNGDSGGLVYTLYNGVFVPVGIHVASYINSFCCPAHTIVDNFGVTMY